MPRRADSPADSPGASTGNVGDDGGPAAVPVLRSRLLAEAGFRHAFFTRQGGVSAPPWDSLNFAAAPTGDDPAAVRENVARAARLLGVSPSRLYYLSQVHGVACRVLDGDEDRARVAHELGDLTASRSPLVACGIRTADCAPVLLADRRSGVAAAIHSGWRGTVDDAVAAGVRVLRELAGAVAGAPHAAPAGVDIDLVAAVGPLLERCCFEVGDDVAELLARCSAAGERAVWRRPGERPHVDLRVVLRAQLEAAGVPPAAIEDVAGCTACDPARFHSFRRDADRSGRMLSAIVPRGEAREGADAD